jgi:hypothetical protein
MKTNYLYCILVMLMIASCQKSEVVPQQSSLPTSGIAPDKAARRGSEEVQTLIRKWAEWVYGRSFSVAPYNDPDGSLQYAAQPYASGIFMLAGGSSPEPVNRTVTISLSQYQYVFVGLVTITGLDGLCDPTFGPHGGQSHEAFFQSFIKEAFNGPKDLSLLWDGASLLSTKQKDARANSGAWSFYAHPDYTGCTEGLTTAYADGYWAKIPLTPGTHTLTVGGNLDFRRFKDEFSSIVNYTIHVVE